MQDRTGTCIGPRRASLEWTEAGQIDGTANEQSVSHGQTVEPPSKCCSGRMQLSQARRSVSGATPACFRGPRSQSMSPRSLNTWGVPSVGITVRDQSVSGVGGQREECNGVRLRDRGGRLGGLCLANRLSEDPETSVLLIEAGCQTQATSSTCRSATARCSGRTRTGTT